MGSALHGLSGVSDWLLGPLVRLHPLAALAAASLVSALLVLVVYKHTSSQRSIARVKDRVWASFLAMTLYKDSLRVIAWSGLSIVGNNLRYLALTLVPLAVMALPMTLLMVQLDGWLGYRPLRPGERAVVAAELDGDVMRDDVELVLSRGLVADAPAVRSPAEHTIHYRVRAEGGGLQSASIRVGGELVRKTIPVAGEAARISLVRHGGGLLPSLLHPGEPPIDGPPVRSIAVDFPAAEVDVLGVGVHWAWVYLVLTLVFALSLRRAFGVTF